MPPIVARPDAAASALEILERTFKPLVLPVAPEDNPSGLGGVYLLAYRGDVVYIGQSDDIAFRLYAHARRDKSFDSASWVSLPIGVRHYYEGAFIRALRPKYNRNSPPHCGYDNEILEGFGLAPHDDEYENARTWRPACRGEEVPPSPIRDARIAAGMTQNDVAVRLGISAAAVGQWEAGVTKPSMFNFMTLAEILGVRPESLLLRPEAA